MSNDDEYIDAEGGFSSDLNEALIEFGKKSVTDSITVVNEFIKMMIPLTTGLITAYFALLQFLGVKSVLDTNILSHNQLTDPSIFMLYSLGAFIITSFPVFWKFDIGNLASVTNYRYLMIGWRYLGAGAGMGLFLYSIYLMISVVGKLL